MSAQHFVPSGPVGPVGPHLGERISAFVDDALPADARDRALVHIAGCPPCRLEVESSQLLKVRLSVLPAPQVPPGLTARLLAMAEPGGPIPPRPSQLPTQPRVIGVPSRPTADRPTAARPTAARPLGSRPAGRSNRTSGASPRRTVRLAALAGAALSTMVVAVVGLSSGVGPDTPRAPISQLTTNVGSTSNTDPMLDVSRVIRRVESESSLVGAP